MRHYVCVAKQAWLCVIMFVLRNKRGCAVMPQAPSPVEFCKRKNAIRTFTGERKMVQCQRAAENSVTSVSTKLHLSSIKIRDLYFLFRAWKFARIIAVEIL